MRWRPALKWIGLYLLANLLGGVIGVDVGLGRDGAAVIAGAIFIGMVVASRLKRRRQT